MALISGSYSLLLLGGPAADALVADIVEKESFEAPMAIDRELAASTIAEHLMEPIDGLILFDCNLVVLRRARDRDAIDFCFHD